jgi:hypothetical protein
MTDTDFESSLTEVFRRPDIAPSEDSVRYVLTAERRHRNWRRPLVISLAVLCCVGGLAAIIPGARASVQGALGAVGDFIHSDNSAPGPSITQVTHAGWVNDLPKGPGNGPAPPEAHVLATAANGERLLAYRDSEHPARICFLYGSFGGECRQQSDPILKALLSSGPLGLLARTQDKDGAIAIWGLVGDGVVSIRAKYANGSTQTVSARYGFITPSRASTPTTIEALDAQHEIVASADPTDPRLTQCRVSECAVALLGQGE